jgi:F420-non-reducing hydrogenase large subunit
VTRRVTIDPLTRLEGHGKIEIFLDDAGEVEEAYLQIPELRGFERFCIGRPAEEMPRITSQICGVCPAAHHLASAQALDDLWQVEPPPAAHAIRELYLSLFFLEDHALHFYYLGGPDLLVGPAAPPAERNVLGIIARLGAEVGARVTRARKVARSAMASIAGRAAHPVFALPGGVSRPLPAETIAELRAAGPELVDFAASSLDLVERVVRGGPPAEVWARALEAEAFHLRTANMGLVDEEDRVTFYRGDLRVVDASGAPIARFAPRDYRDHLAEHEERWTFVKFPYLRALGFHGFEEGAHNGIYRVGPLGRVNASRAMATPRAEEERQRMVEALGGLPIHRTLAFHWARLVEMLQAAETVARLAEDSVLAEKHVRNLPTATPTEGVGVVEAARGTLFHRYRTDPQGLLTEVELIVASQQNAAPIQISVRKAARALIRGGRVEPALLAELEMAYRAYDPCNACATHALPGELPLEVTLRDRHGVRERLTRGLLP